MQDPYYLRGERAVSVYDVPQLLQFSWVYELPVGRGKHFGPAFNPVLNAIASGWQTNGLWRIDNGTPIIPTLLNTLAIPTFGQRPILTASLKRASGSTSSIVNSYFANPEVLVDTSVAAPYTFGSAPRTITSVRQPGGNIVSASLLKDFSLNMLREGAHLQFRAEAFNLLNHPQFAGPVSDVGASNFGQITRTIANGRELQLALKLYW